MKEQTVAHRESNAGDRTPFVDKVATLVSACADRPSWDEYFMATAFLIASRSSCNRLNVGCVLALDNRIIAAGYNGYLPGAPHVARVRDGHEQGTVHAEQNAISDAARRGVRVAGSVAYVTHFPCLNCAKILAAAGVSAIKYHFDYRNDPFSQELLAETGLKIYQL